MQTYYRYLMPGLNGEEIGGTSDIIALLCVFAGTRRARNFFRDNWSVVGYFSGVNMREASYIFCNLKPLEG